MGTEAPKWLEWAREIYSLSKAGLTYSKSEYDLVRYRRLLEITAEMLASQSRLPNEAVFQTLSMQDGYATPKVDVRGAAFRDGKVLLVQEKADGKWCLPGGWADIGELPSSVVAREFREESGFSVEVEKVIGVYDANHIPPLEFFHAYKLIFLCAITAGEPQPSYETLDSGFFARDALPPLSEFRTNRRMLEEAFAHLDHPNRPTYFE